jgi:hypothetical protein
MEEWLAAVANVGFPIFIAVYLVVRIEAKLDALTIAINLLGKRL